jgi:malate synthase
VAKQVFDEFMPQPNQIDRKREEVRVTASDLLAVPTGTITEAGLRLNVDVGIQYLEAWLRGNGAVPIYNLMEDAATAEISRAQVWQWARHGAKLEGGRPVTPQLVQETISQELDKMRDRVGAERFEKGKFQVAADLFGKMMLSGEFNEFLTLPAYEFLD